MFLLNNSDIENILNVKNAIKEIEYAFKELQLGHTILPNRTTIYLKNGTISQMSVYLKKSDIAITKVFGIFPKNFKYNLPTNVSTIFIYDTKTGKIIGIMDGEYITAIRTGALGAVAVKYLSRENSKNLAIIGCGVQGKAQLIAIKEVRELDKVYVYDKIPNIKLNFANEMSKKIGLDIIPTDSVYSAIKSADIIVTATTSSKPVIKGKWLGEGVHINAVGSFYPNHRELDTETILKSKVIVDLKDAALKEAGDILIPIKEGKINKEYIYGELGEIIIGKKTGRINNNEITIFKSVGLAVQDAAIANLILKNYYKTLTSKN